jgi:hypothetical protein
MAKSGKPDGRSTSRLTETEGQRVEPEGEIPDAPDLRDGEPAPGWLPESEQPGGDHAPAGDGSEIGGDTTALGKPVYDEVPDVPGAGPGSLDPDLEAILNAEDTSGGLDGRNDAQFDGGGPTDPNAGGPMGGLEGAAGKVNVGQQAVLDHYKAKALAAAANGDYEAADKIAGQAQQFLIREGINQPPPEPETDTGTGTDLISGAGRLGGGPQHVWDNETGEVKLVDSTEDSGGTVYASKYSQLGQVDTDASGVGGEGAAPPASTGTNEDRTEDGEGLPDHLRDPSAGIDDEYEVKQWETATGGDVDPDPNADHRSVGGPVDDDPTDYVAEYDQDHVTPDEVDPARLDSHIDWEFMEGG